MRFAQKGNNGKRASSVRIRSRCGSAFFMEILTEKDLKMIRKNRIIENGC
jgi:hypothetical protein